MTHERGRPPHPELLTPAEQRVLEELRAGHQNAEIASRLGISVNTVRYHVSNILGKLELPNRTALRAWDGEGSRRRWGWLGMAGLLGGRGTSGVRALVASVTVGVVAAGLLVVGSGRVTLPSMVEEAPVAVASEVVEPQDFEGETATSIVGEEQESANESVCGTALVRTNADAFAGPSTTLSADTDGRPVGCSPLALLRGRSLADAFEVPIEAN